MTIPGLRTSPRLLALLIPLLLAACGGGGGGGGGSGGGSSSPAPTVNEPQIPAQPSVINNASKVGIIDSGLSPGHSEINYANVQFASYIAGGSNTLNDNQGINGHGTVVALTLLGLSSSSALYMAQGSQNNIFQYGESMFTKSRMQLKDNKQ